MSVSIVAYLTPAEELDRLLGELRCGFEPVTVTVVDNSPTQELRSVVEAQGALYLWSGENIGFGAGHNIAMREAIHTSAYHLVCNPDISMGPGVLSALADFMDSSPEVGLVMPRVLYPDGDEQRLCKLLPSPADLLVRRFLGEVGGKRARRSRERYELRHIELETTREVPSLSGCFMFLRTSVLRETGLFDPRFFMYMEDVDLCRRIGAMARTVFYPAVSVTHDYAKGSYHNWKLLQYHVLSAIRYFGKWGWLFDPERKELNSRLAVWSEERSRPSLEPSRLGSAESDQRHAASRAGNSMQHPPLPPQGESIASF